MSFQRLVREKVYIEELVTKDLDLFDQIENFVIRNKGDLITSPDGTTLINLPIGPNGSFLKSDSTTSTGLKWDATVPTAPVLSVNGKPLIPPEIPPVAVVIGINEVTPTLNKGDIMVGNGTDLVAFPVGTDGQALILNSGTATGLEWADFSGDVVFSVNGQIGEVVLTFDDFAPGSLDRGDIYVNNGTQLVALPLGNQDEVLTADSTQATGVRWTTFPPNNVTSVNGKTGDVILVLDDFAPFPITKGQLIGEIGGGSQVIPITNNDDDYVLTVDSTQPTGVDWKSRFLLQSTKSFRVACQDITNLDGPGGPYPITTSLGFYSLPDPISYYNNKQDPANPIIPLGVTPALGGSLANKLVTGLYKTTIILNFTATVGITPSNINIRLQVGGVPGDNYNPRLGLTNFGDKAYFRYEGYLFLQALNEIELIVEVIAAVTDLAIDTSKDNIWELQYLGN